MSEKNRSAPQESRESAISPENARFTQIDYKGTYGTIMRDPKTGDFAVILPNGKTTKISREEALVKTPPFGSERMPTKDGGVVLSPEGPMFNVGKESRPGDLAEIFQLAREKTETGTKGQTAEYVDLMLLSPYGIAVVKTNAGYKITSERTGESLRFHFKKGEEAIGAAKMFRVIGKAVIAAETCQKKDLLLADCKAYSETTKRWEKELRIDNSLISDDLLASAKELSEHVPWGNLNLAGAISSFVNASVTAVKAP